MTPPRLTEVSCPICKQTSWFIDSDYRGMDDPMVPYDQRVYPCSRCSNTGRGWTLIQQSPPVFLLQPHSSPMTRADFDYWVAILQANFPDHPRLAELGRRFVPNTSGAENAKLWDESHRKLLDDFHRK